MRILKVEFTVAEINGVTPVRKNAYLDVSASGGIVRGVQQIDVIRRYATSLSVVNSSGQNVEMALLANEQEEAEFIASPDNYFFLLPLNGIIGASTKIGRVYKVSVRKQSTNVTSGLRIDFMQHTGTLKIN